MPIYEYRCQACGASHEAIQKLSDAPLVDCPECGQPQLKKQVSAPAFRLKGGGWYETDFKTGDKKNLAGDKSADSGAGKSDGGKTGDTATKNDSKPAAKKGGDSSAA